MNRFLDMMQESVIIQGTITIGLLGTIVYLYVTGQDVPETLVGMTMLVLGFYFGGKVENTKIRGSIDRMVERKIDQR